MAVNVRRLRYQIARGTAALKMKVEKYYSTHGPQLPLAPEPGMQLMHIYPVGYGDGSGVLIPFGLAGYPST
jgi:hypothetical protein